MLAMLNVAYDFDPVTSLFVHKMTEAEPFNEVNYILTVSEFLEILEYKKPTLILIHTSQKEMLPMNKLSGWLEQQVLPQIARLGIRKMAIVSEAYPKGIVKRRTYHHFPWLTIGTFKSESTAKQWLLKGMI